MKGSCECGGCAFHELGCNTDGRAVGFRVLYPLSNMMNVCHRCFVSQMGRVPTNEERLSIKHSPISEEKYRQQKQDIADCDARLKKQEEDCAAIGMPVPTNYCVKCSKEGVFVYGICHTCQREEDALWQAVQANPKTTVLMDSFYGVVR